MFALGGVSGHRLSTVASIPDPVQLSVGGRRLNLHPVRRVENTLSGLSVRLKSVRSSQISGVPQCMAPGHTPLRFLNSGFDMLRFVQVVSKYIQEFPARRKTLKN